MKTSSTKSHMFSGTSMPRTSTQPISSRESEMSPSTEDPELSSRVSRSQSGQLPKKLVVGNSMLTPDKLGKMPLLISTQSGPQPPTSERDKSQILSSGSDLNNSEKEAHPDSSTTRSPSQIGSDIKVILITPRKFSTLSLTPIKLNN